MIRMSLPRVLPLLLVLASGWGRAESLPVLPPSTRVLSQQEVKNFWINTLRRKAVPDKPSSLRPGELAAWKGMIRRRGSLILAIRNGEHDTPARLVQLRHNIRAWREQGADAEALAVEAELQKLEEHLSRMRTLAAQRDAAEAQVDAAESLDRIEAKLSTIDTTCNHSCSQSCGH